MSVRIVVDEREKNSAVPNLLRQAGAAIDFAQLKVGDYIVSSETAIERKTVKDLLSSIFDGRLFIQCSELIKYFAKPVVIIEGDILDLRINLEGNQDNESKKDIERMDIAYEALATVAIDFRIPILHTPSSDYTAQLLVNLVNKSLSNGNVNGPFLRRIKKGNPTYAQQLNILSSVPGIGEKLALRMLKKYHTPKMALNASAAELARIPGFGLARAQKVRKILDNPYIEDADSTMQGTLKDHLV